MSWLLLTLASPASASSLVLSGTLRDFTPATNPDFQYTIVTDRNIVMPYLGADGKPIYNTSDYNPSINSQSSFDQWFRDVPGVNVAIPYSVSLSNSSAYPNIYTYVSNSFFPLDGQGFGNYGGSGHNFHFTYELSTFFTYQGGETFTFIGDDDLFIYINGVLAVDLGGIHPAQGTSISLDALASNLGISPGGTYSFHLFFAERHTVASEFRIDTTIEFQPEVCLDGRDNDTDGQIDGNDVDCQVCGDGDRDPNEDCDDGNTQTGDGCSSGCREEDQDGDGHGDTGYGGDDCNDGDATIYPGAADMPYDGIDSDCAGNSDNDADGDGHDDDGHGGEDCDDADASIYPGAADVPYDGIDSDCAGDSDYDTDDDGHDDDAYGGDDCDDGDANIYPGATDVPYDGIDSDCAGDSDYDADDDGHDDETYGGDDCNDGDASVFPGAADSLYDGVDSDCAGDSDYDADGDGFDDDGFGGTDCDDSNAAINPDAQEDGEVAPYAASTVLSSSQGLRKNGSAVLSVRSNPVMGLEYESMDQDRVFYSMGFGGSIEVEFDCAISNGAGDDLKIWEKTYAGANYAAETADVYGWDGADWVYLGSATNLPSSARSNVPTTFDLGGLDQVSRFRIVDTTASGPFELTADGFDLNGVYSLQSCVTTICDGIDNDCDADIDEDQPDQDNDGICNSLDEDQDGDGYSSVDAGGTDCDDLDDGIHPSATEVVADGIDQDCTGVDGGVDSDSDGISDEEELIEGSDPTVYDNPDFDADGHDAVAYGGDDCDDQDASIYAGASDAWYDGIDSDCAGNSDHDADGDGHDATAQDGDDCDDGNSGIYGGAAEQSDGLDNDCNGVVEEGDTDGDGLTDGDELFVIGSDFDNADTDGDGVWDGDEVGDSYVSPRDSDGDGSPDYDDTDDDADGILTEEEIGSYDATDPSADPPDTDGDGDPDHIDMDADGDGIGDSTEGVDDPDADGRPAFQDADDDGDGIPTATEQAGDADGDGDADPDADMDGSGNAWDDDSDGDGISDLLEGTADDDGDGIANYLDAAIAISPGDSGDSAEEDSAAAAAESGGTGDSEEEDSGHAITPGHCSTAPAAGLAGLLVGLGLALRRRR